ncbi:Rqc2 family fibronectin-binding protein [Petrachloros mirabilis]
MAIGARMSLTANEIHNVLEEIRPAIQGGWLQKIHQPSDRSIVLEVRAPGRTHRLLISCDPNICRLHLLFHPSTNPESPPPFCQFLRGHLQGARIDGIEQIPDDRIVTLRLTTKEGPRELVCGLTGKTANLLVLDENHRIMRDLNRQQGNTGRLYQAPPQQKPGTTRPASRRFSSSPESEGYSLSAAIEDYFREKEITRARNDAIDERRRVLGKTIKREERRIAAWKNDLAKTKKYRDYVRYGELIKTNLHSVKKGMDHITVIDYFDESMPEVTVPIDPTRSPRSNMDDYFKKHRKYLAADRELKPRIAQAEQTLARLRHELAEIEEGTWLQPPSLRTVLQAKAATASPPRKIPHHDRRGPFRRFISTDGLPIFVGRNAKENDELTFGIAKSDDLWLHARGTPGSHVVIRLEKGMDPPPETLQDAATLALLYSDLKKSGKGEVIYTKRKWVKKAKGQATGAVFVTQEKSLYINLDRQRLEALKMRSNREQPA